MSFINVDLRSRTPIFEQIVSCVEELVLRGIMKPDEQLPSVRSLASELGINPNTIQKAYAELENRGIIYSLTARGSFVSSEIGELRERSRKQLLKSIKGHFQEAEKLGVSRSDITALLNEVWRDKDDTNS